jgi:hypothetical protein
MLNVTFNPFMLTVVMLSVVSPFSPIIRNITLVPWMPNLVVEVVDPELEEGECGKDGWTKSDHEESIPVANVTKLFTALIYKWL